MRGSPKTLAALGWIVVALASLWPLWAAAHSLEGRNDDTYITLTYVKSLVAGEGWRFNGGPVALGTTAPLFALTVAALATLLPAVEIAHLGVGLSTFFWLLSGWLLALRGTDFGLSRFAGQLAGAALLLQGGYWLIGLGMESSMLVAGLLGATWLAARGHALAAGVASAALFLVRPEGIALAPLLALWLARPGAPDRGRKLLRFALGAGGLLLAWAAYALPTFGSILSNSAAAKLDQGQGWPSESFLRRLWREWLPQNARRFGLSAWLSLLWPLAAGGAALVARRARPLLPLLLWAPLFLLGYGLLDAPGYWWYQLPLVALLHLLAALALAALIEARRPLVRAVGITALLLYLVGIGRLNSPAVASPPSDPRAPGYRAVAAWLNANSAPMESVAYVEIGYLGYYSENRIVDLVGLADPALRENASQLDLAANFAVTEPDFFLYHVPMGWLLDPIVADPAFAARYHPVAEFPHVGDHPLVLYRKR